MKNKLLLCTIALILFCSFSHANRLRIENDEDIGKITRSISSLWEQHREERNNFLSKNLQLKDIENLQKSNHDLLTYIRIIGKENANKDISESIKYLQAKENNQDLTLELRLLQAIINK